MTNDVSRPAERVFERPAPTKLTSPRDDPLAKKLRGFGPLGLVAILVIYLGNTIFAPLSALLVLAWAWRSRTPWRELGFARPKSWVRTVAAGIALGVVLKLVMKAVVMPLLGAPPVNQAFQYLAGNTAALPATVYAIVIGAGFGEETMFRGWMFERFGKLLGSGRWAKAVIVLVTSVWFGVEHYSLQGLAGVQQATIVGLLYGTIVAVTGRIWIVMIAHAAFDAAAVTIIYLNLETALARLVFG
jgi:membrane protease YdiL (CAAX protease family)